MPPDMRAVEAPIERTNATTLIPELLAAFARRDTASGESTRQPWLQPSHGRDTVVSTRGSTLPSLLGPALESVSTGDTAGVDRRRLASESTPSTSSSLRGPTLQSVVGRLNNVPVSGRCSVVAGLSHLTIQLSSGVRSASRKSP